MMPAQADRVLAFWFDELDDRQRFTRDDAVDGEIAQRFGALHAELSRGVPIEWTREPRMTLAAIIILDQFSRNLFRDDARAYAQDPAALAMTKSALDRGLDQPLSADERQFLYMPLMHSEVLADVQRCAGLMKASDVKAGLEFAERHAAVIVRFGRYPARNAALGRHTTAAEADFLEKTPLGF